ncbi:MAG: hypothetical protein WCP28_22215 [Actinomycetes bacterium]
MMGAGLPQYLHKLNRRADSRDVDPWMVPGNHEDYPWLARQPVDELGRRMLAPRILALPRGHRFTLSDGERPVVFAAVGGAVSRDRKLRTPGRSWWPEEQITDDEERRISDQPAVDVLLTHDAPAGASPPQLPRATLGEWAGIDVMAAADAHSARLQRIVDVLRPAVLYHGHSYARYDQDIRCGKPGYRSWCAVHGLACDDMPGNTVTVSIGELAARIDTMRNRSH